MDLEIVISLHQRLHRTEKTCAGIVVDLHGMLNPKAD
jgi:hypothetical protein